MKLLHEPDRAPNDATAQRAKRLSAKRVLPFDAIQAQVSDDKAILAKTVFERHAGAQGIGRIGWNALAAARFRMDHASDDQDWRAMALLVELERTVPRIEAFVDSPKYSHDVFRRIVRRLLANDVLDKRIFHATEPRLSQRPPQGSKEAALSICTDLLDEMAAGKIHLSRNRTEGCYADEASLDALIRNRYASRSPAPAPEKDPPDDRPSAPAEGGSNSRQGTAPQPSDDLVQNTPSDDPPPARRPSDAPKIPYSATIAQLLEDGRHAKLANLYKSLTTLFPGPNPVLMWVGAWSFLESLGARLTTSNNRFDWLISKTRDYVQGPGKSENKGSLQTAIKRIQDEGNSNKHDAQRYTMDGRQLAIEFQTLEGFIIWLLRQQISGPIASDNKRSSE